MILFKVIAKDSTMLEQIILSIGRLKDVLRGFQCNFKVGDLVELKDGTGYPLLVVEIDKTRNMKEPLLYCRWYDRETKETRYNFFPESRVRGFNWALKDVKRGD